MGAACDTNNGVAEFSEYFGFTNCSAVMLAGDRPIVTDSDPELYWLAQKYFRVIGCGRFRDLMKPIRKPNELDWLTNGGLQPGTRAHDRAGPGSVEWCRGRRNVVTTEV